MKNTIEHQLLKATKLKYESENRQEQLHDLTNAVAVLPDPEWGKLSTVAQKWYNKAADAIAKQEEISDFSAAGGSDKAAAPKKLEKTMAKKKGATIAKAAKTVQGNGKAARGERAASRKAASARKAVTPHGSGSTALIHSALVKDPLVTTAELVKGLRTKGNRANKTTVSTLKSRALDLTKRQYEAGHFKDPYAKKVAALIAAS